MRHWTFVNETELYIRITDRLNEGFLSLSYSHEEKMASVVRESVAAASTSLDELLGWLLSSYILNLEDQL